MKAVLPPSADPNTLYVIDISGYVFRAYHALPPLSSPKGEPTHAVLGVVNMLEKLLRERKPHWIAVAMDSRGPSFRKDLDANYKANRPPPPEDLSQQIERVKQISEAFGFKTFSIPGMEADDIIATLVAEARKQKHRTVIVSADKDLLQLVGDDVVMYDTMRERIFGIDETVEKFGVKPEQVVDVLALIGDSSDNVPGVPSVGPKTAATLLQQYHSLDELYKKVESVSKANLKQKLIDNQAQAFLSRKLIELKHDVPLDYRWSELEYRGVNIEPVRALYTELGFTRHLVSLNHHSPPADASSKMNNDCAADVTIARLDNENAFKQWASDLKTSATLYLDPILSGGKTQEELGLFLAYAGSHRAWMRFDVIPALSATIAACLNKTTPNIVTTDTKRLAHWLGRTTIEPRAVFDLSLAGYVLGKPDDELKTLLEPPLDLDLNNASFDGYLSTRIALAAGLQDRLTREITEAKLTYLLNEVEVPLASVLASMEALGVLLDLELLKSLHTLIGSELKTIEARCYEAAGRPVNLASPKQLEALLFDELKLPVIKKNKSSRSTDHEVLEELALLHELPRLILEHRKLSKLLNTYVDTLPNEVDDATGRVHTNFNQTLAATGRLSSKDPNLQNIPIRDEVGRKLREAFIARPGWKIFSADYSQIELRVLAHLSDDRALTKAFEDNIDIHTLTASAIFNVEPDKVTREQRGRAKTVNFGVVYGQSAFALGRSLKIERAEAARYIDTFFMTYHGVRSYFDKILSDAKKSGFVTTMFGRKRHLPDLNSKNFSLRGQAERMACNTPLQGTAADIIKIAMVRIDHELTKQKLKSCMLLSVHDELVFEVAPGEDEALRLLVVEHMEHAAELKVPLLVEAGIGQSWGTAH